MQRFFMEGERSHPCMARIFQRTAPAYAPLRFRGNAAFTPEPEARYTSVSSAKANCKIIIIF